MKSSAKDLNRVGDVIETVRELVTLCGSFELRERGSD